jgi:chlorite dismutase
MGEKYYTDYTGGLSFSKINNGLSSFIKDSNSDRQRDDIKIDDLTKLKANSDLTYTYKSRNYHEIPAGEYRVRARFMGIIYTASDFELNQDDGRIWVGQIESYKEGVIIE